MLELPIIHTFLSVKVSKLRSKYTLQYAAKKKIENREGSKDPPGTTFGYQGTGTESRNADDGHEGEVVVQEEIVVPISPEPDRNTDDSEETRPSSTTTKTTHQMSSK